MSGRQTKPKRKMPSNKQGAAAPAAKSRGKSDASKSREVIAAKPKRNIPVVGIAFGVIGALLVAAVALGGNSGPGTAEFGEPVVEGGFLPPFQSSQSDVAIGLEAPTVTGENFDGEAVTVGANGTPTAIVFLAHWCPHCQREVPSVQAWLDSGGGVEGVQIQSVATSVNSARANYPPSDWLDREGWSPEVLLDDVDNTVLAAFGAGGFPYWVFLNADGTVAARTAGQLEIANLEQILRGIAVSQG